MHNGFLHRIIVDLTAAIEQWRTDNHYINQENFLRLMKYITINELIFSRGSLINALGCNTAALWYWNYGTRKEPRSFDVWYESFLSIIRGNFFYESSGNLYYVAFSSDDILENESLYKRETVNEFLNRLREGDIITIPEAKAEEELTVSDQNKLAELGTITENMQEIAQVDKPIDIAPLWAYQMACAEFFTNDKVDYVYNAEIFRQYIKNLWIETIEGISTQSQYTFDYQLNGITFENDALNAVVFQYMVNNADREPVEGTCYQYIISLFSYKRSLKYKDYFTGARTRPIAIGNTNIEVQLGESIEVIDIVASIQKQRFLNIVNKIPRDLKGYTKGIFGKDVAPDWHNPLFICRVSEPIYGQEVENTGEAQITQAVSRTTVLKNKGRQLRFELSGFDRNCILIGFVDFDIARAYSDGIERIFNNVDRFDYYNPFLQYTGDQEIYRSELDARLEGTFGYTGAYMERKQKYNRAFGGFITALPGWTFLESYVGDTTGDLDRRNANTIGPDFIRSKSTELDKFYISLSGHSLANYFHFIIDTYNEISTVRPMSYDPQILG